ncbi:MAG: thiamine-phosphate kinase [Planctomycetota bacterium]
MRENDLLQHIYEANAALQETAIIPPGDDMGAIAFGGNKLLVAVDQVADGVHFDLTNTPIEKIGRKAVTRNLSDIAAMAVKPTAAVAAACLPRDFGEANANALFDAMRATAQDFNCPLIGGDIAMWDGRLLLSVTVFAEPWQDDRGQPIPPVERRGAQPGDGIYVTGQLGHSFPTGHHLDFTPRIELARRLAMASVSRPSAMIDLSDGIAQDLPRLVEHAELDARRLPLRPCDISSDREPWQHALGDGEDYELLFTAPPEADIPDTIADHTDTPTTITSIGTVTDTGEITVIIPDGSRVPLDQTQAEGWEHTA